MDLLSGQGLRIDGRKLDEQRKISCRLGVFTRADGSAYVEQGLTKALAAVYGPHEIRGGRTKALADKVVVNCQCSMATFSTSARKNRPRGDRRSVEITNLLQQTFETAILTQQYPRSQIDIYVEILESDGGDCSVCVNAAALALIDAGIEMKDFVCAAAVTLIKDQPALDLNHFEESMGLPEVQVSLLSKSGPSLQIDGIIHEDHLPGVYDLAVKGCHNVHNILGEEVKRQIGAQNPSAAD